MMAVGRDGEHGANAGRQEAGRIPVRFQDRELASESPNSL